MTDIETHDGEIELGAEQAGSKQRLRLPIYGLYGLALAIATAYPLFRPGRLFLLDWVSGPYMPLGSTQILGLNGGLTAGAPFSALQSVLQNLLGAPSSWLPLIAVFPLSTVGIRVLTRYQSHVGSFAACTLYAINPFVFQRIFVGHFGLLLGYSLLPLATAMAIRHFRSGQRWVPLPALWWAGLIALSPHFLWIYGAVILTSWLSAVRNRGLQLGKVLSLGFALVILNAYIWLPHSATQLPVTTGTSTDLALYQTTSDPRYGLYLNVLGLYGFWRLGPGPTLPKTIVSGWPLFLLALLVVMAVGALSALYVPRHRSNNDTRHTARVLLIVTALGYLLALGAQGPTAGIFRLLYFHLPFFDLMREPQKFLMLTAMGYSYFFGCGIERLTNGFASHRWRAMLTLILALGMPIAYTPTMFGGLNGQISVVNEPNAWIHANALMGRGPGQILFLPWHLYMEFPFSDGRVINNPAPLAFQRSVISGDNVQASGVATTSTSPRSAYLEKLFNTRPEPSNFGRSIAPLGIQFVVLAKTVDWQSYAWLSRQKDLHPILNTDTLEVWRNLSYAGIGTASPPRTIRELSPVSYLISAGRPGILDLDAAYEPGWTLLGRPADETAEGTLSFKTSSAGGIVSFAPWTQTRLGYLISAASYALFFGYEIQEALRTRRKYSIQR